MRGSGGTPSGRAYVERPRGNIEQLASGSLRVRVYAGVDVLTGRELYLKETIAAGPDAAARARRRLDELVEQVRQSHQPRTNAPLRLLIERHLQIADVERRTKETLTRYLRKHIAPFVGDLPIGSVNAQALDGLYAELRRCRDHCDGRTPVVHHTVGEHRCTARCRPHVCSPLAAWTIRKIHYLISAAYETAIAWDWISVNPTRRARKPAPPAPDPQPPSAEEAAALITECWRRGLGPLAWLAMTTGARRGELLALRWRNLQVHHTLLTEHDCASAGCRHTLVIRRALCEGDNGQLWESDTKSHQRRHVALDEQTVAVLAEHRRNAERDAAALGVTIGPDHYVFAASTDGTVPHRPAAISARYRRCAKALGIDTKLKSLRHYSATELISAGVDVRTVAGRLGHGGGGTTTLKVYAAWVSAADQHVSTVLMSRMPARPATPPAGEDRAKADPRWPHEQLAAGLHADWLAGTLTPGTELTVKDIASAHHVAVGTAHRAVTHLNQWGVLTVRNGRPSVVNRPPDPPAPIPSAVPTGSEARAASPDHTSTLSRAETPTGLEAETASATEPAAAVAHLTGTARPETPGSAAAGAHPEANALAETARRERLTLELVRLGTPVRRLLAQADPGDLDTLQQFMRDAVRRLGATPGEFGDFEMAVHRDGEPEPVATVVIAA